MKKPKPESKEITLPRIDKKRYRQMQEAEVEKVRRAQFLMSHDNILEAQKHRKTYLGVYALVLFLGAIGALIWALTR